MRLLVGVLILLAAICVAADDSDSWIEINSAPGDNEVGPYATPSPSWLPATAAPRLVSAVAPPSPPPPKSSSYMVRGIFLSGPIHNHQYRLPRWHPHHDDGPCGVHHHDDDRACQ